MQNLAAAENPRLMSRLRLKQFELIIGVADGLSFRQLSERMALSQPAISKMARELEQTLGAPVFNRLREGVSLTPFGGALVHDARMVLNKIGRLENEIADMRGGKGRTLRVGAPSYTTVSLLSEPVAQLAARHPSMRIEMVDGVANSLFTMLMAGELDFVVGSLPARNLTDAEASMLHVDILYPDELCFVAQRRGDGGGRELALEDLLHYAWVTPTSDSLVRNALRVAMLAQKLPVPVPAIESSVMPSIAAIVAAHPGFIGVLRADAAVYMSRRLGLELLNVRPKIPLPPVAIVRAKDVEPSAAAQELFELLRDRARVLFENSITADAKPGPA